jgi:hypothetical protein
VSIPVADLVSKEMATGRLFLRGDVGRSGDRNHRYGRAGATGQDRVIGLGATMEVECRRPASVSTPKSL